MVLTSRTQMTLFANNTVAASGGLVRLPLSVVPHYETRCHVTGAIIPAANKPLFRPNLWSSEEHERFLHGLELFPNGPWKEVAKVVGTKSTRQTMTHAQSTARRLSAACKAREKPTKSNKISQHSQKQPTAPVATCGIDTARQTSSQPESLRMRFVDKLLGCSPMGADEVVSTVASPTEVYTDAFDTFCARLEASVRGGDWSVLV